MENMKKFVYIGVEKDYNERDFQEVYDGLVGSIRTAVYFDPETRKIYHENFWGELVPVEFPNRTTVIYNGSSEHLPQFVHLIVKDEPETEESDGFWYNQENSTVFYVKYTNTATLVSHKMVNGKHFVLTVNHKLDQSCDQTGWYLTITKNEEETYEGSVGICSGWCDSFIDAKKRLMSHVAYKEYSFFG